ncbi:MAG: hypothetical protein WCN95_04665 [bacterium]
MHKVPKIYEQQSAVNGKVYSCFILAYYEQDGHRVRRSFPSKAEAERALREWEDKQKAHVEKQKILNTKIGMKADKLGPDELLDAVNGLDLLKGLASITEAASFYMKHNKPSGGKVRVADAAAEFFQAKIDDNCRPATILSYRNLTGNFVKDMGARYMNEITLLVLKEWLSKKKFTRSTRTAYLRHIGAFFSFCVEHGYMAENPARSKQLKPAKEDRHLVTYLTANDTRNLLSAASDHYPDMVPYLAISLFAGLRPVEIHGEHSGHSPLDWRDIDLVKGKIVVRPEQDKIRRGRNVTISDNLRAWLLPYRRDSGPVSYQRRQLDGAVKKSSVKYSKDVLRHSFATWHWALHRHEGQTACELGDTLDTVRKHYVNSMVDTEDAAAYWAIAPVEADKQVMSIKTA